MKHAAFKLAINLALVLFGCGVIFPFRSQHNYCGGISQPESRNPI
jgi:hypothetical protein